MLESVVQNEELISLSNGNIFSVGHWTKTKGLFQNTVLLRFSSRYSLLSFAHIPVLILESVEQHEELNSLSNGNFFSVGHWTKTKGFVQNTEFWGFSSKYSLLTFANKFLLTVKALE